MMGVKVLAKFLIETHASKFWVRNLTDDDLRGVQRLIGERLASGRGFMLDFLNAGRHTGVWVNPASDIRFVYDKEGASTNSTQEMREVLETISVLNVEPLQTNSEQDSED